MKAPNPGIYTVRHPQRETPFMLSVVDAIGGIRGVRGYEIGEKPPLHGKHLMLSPSVRNWLEELIPVTKEPKAQPACTTGL